MNNDWGNNSDKKYLRKCTNILFVCNCVYCVSEGIHMTGVWTGLNAAGTGKEITETSFTMRGQDGEELR